MALFFFFFFLPIQGDAAFWWNLKRSGDGDDSTRHAGCPVLVGSKWGEFIPRGDNLTDRPLEKWWERWGEKPKRREVQRGSTAKKFLHKQMVCSSLNTPHHFLMVYP